IANRVRCEQVAAEAIPERDHFDLVMAFNCIHDMANPRGALRAIHNALKPDGAMLWSEAKAADLLEDNLSSWGRSMYGASTMHCMTVSLASGGEGLGSVIGSRLAHELAREAGFTRFGALPVDNQFHQIFVLRR
ncbi:MAG: methyltransferase domain-containing protein, partial [Candidatus Binataceae bacterium]